MELDKGQYSLDPEVILEKMSCVKDGCQAVL